MKKWVFWSAMCTVSLVNGAFFVGGSAGVMGRGIAGTDNQASLLFIPVLWLMAIWVLAALNLCTLLAGIQMEKGRTIHPLEVFHLSGLSRRAKASRAGFFLAAGLLMLFGYALFAPDMPWAIGYALSGGLLLLFLNAWIRAFAQRAAYQ